MMRFLLLLIVTVLSLNPVSGQVVLKKKEVKEKLILISEKISNGDYEVAMGYFFSNSEIIKEEKVSKKYKEKYNQIKLELEAKREVFEVNKKKVDNFKKEYVLERYCSSLGMLQLTLTKANSYKRSQEIQYKIVDKLNSAKIKCEANSLKIIEWEDSYKANDFEVLYKLLSISKFEKSFFNSGDLKKLDDLNAKLKSKYTTYSEVKRKLLVEPLYEIKSIDYESINYDESNQLILRLNSFLSNSAQEVLKLEGNNPNLLSEHVSSKVRISETVKKLEVFSEANKPLTNKEISLKVFSGKSISTDFIMNKCKESSTDLYNIYHLDVFYYYKLEGYDTDLKKQVYKKTVEYKNQLTELKKMRVELLKTTHYTKLTGLFKSIAYDVNKKGFDLEISQNWGMGTYSAMPPKSIFIGGGAKVRLNKLPSRQVPFKMLGKGINTEMLLIRVNEENGLEIEGNLEDIDLYYLFIPSSKATLKYKFYNNVSNSYAGWYTMTNDVITSTSLRIIVANKISGKIYYDKVY